MLSLDATDGTPRCIIIIINNIMFLLSIKKESTANQMEFAVSRRTDYTRMRAHKYTLMSLSMSNAMIRNSSFKINEQNGEKCDFQHGIVSKMNLAATSS